MLTIIIPTKNRAKYIQSLLEVLLEKNFIEKILIANDGSTDDTEKILNGYKNNKKLSIYSNHQSIGALKSICKLYEFVQTKYLMFMSDDDYFDSSLLEKILNMMDQAKSVVGFGKYYIESNNLLEEVNHSGWSARENLGDFLSLISNDHYMFGAATIFRKSSLPMYSHNGKIVPFDLNLNSLVEFDHLGEFRAMDWDLALNMSYRFPGDIYYLDDFVATFRKTHNQLSSKESYHNTGRAALEMAFLIIKYFSIHKVRKILFKNNNLIENISNLLAHKINDTRSLNQDYLYQDYLPVLNASRSLLDSLREQ